jgi:hypothetical protein
MMDLVAKGHIRPIAPLTVFPFEEIDAAFRLMRGGNHVGKVVISSGEHSDVKIQVSEIPIAKAMLILLGTSSNS